jgi:DNA-binding NarL/FixJ family response regulator
MAVLQLVARGHTNSEIADRVGMSLIAAAARKAHTMQKLGLRTRMDALRYAQTNG